MIKQHLRAVALEQLNRIHLLLQLVPHPAKHKGLELLSDKCERILEERRSVLEDLLVEIKRRPDTDLRDVFRSLRVCIRRIQVVEYYGIPALTLMTSDMNYMNSLIFQIHKEIQLPITPPSVACISTEYYHFHPDLNVIFVPIGDSNFLLQLPDLFHEIGHEILAKMNSSISLDGVKKGYMESIEVITDYYQNIINRKEREDGPPTILSTIRKIHSKWKLDWINEFFCDLFGVYTVGPAYVWSHLHLVMKSCDSIYSFPDVIQADHPSDDSRMKMLYRGLNFLGFSNECNLIKQRWNSLPIAITGSPPNEYQYAFPGELLDEVAECILDSFRSCGLLATTLEKLKEKDSVISILNNAWERFWKDIDGFRIWEKATIDKLRQIVK